VSRTVAQLSQRDERCLRTGAALWRSGSTGKQRARTGPSRLTFGFPALMMAAAAAVVSVRWELLKRRFSRGRFLRTSAVGVGGALSFGALEGLSIAGDTDGTLSGIVAAVMPPDEMILRRPGRARVRVAFREDAYFWHDAPSRLSAFQPGEEVVADGEWSGTTFVASRLSHLYRPYHGPIVAKSARTMTLPESVVLTTHYTRVQDETGAAESWANLHVGDEVHVVGRIDPRFDDPVALLVMRAGDD
jgi:hypothetical protein